MKLSTYSAIAAISVGMIAGAPAISSAASCGDVNGNGSVTVADVVKLFQDALSSADPADCDGAGTLQCGDINESGTITVSDVVAAFSLALGEELLYECESEGPTISCPGGTAVVSSNVVTNEVWPASCRIELDGTIFVTDSAVLNPRFMPRRLPPPQPSPATLTVSPVFPNCVNSTENPFAALCAKAFL